MQKKTTQEVVEKKKYSRNWCSGDVWFYRSKACGEKPARTAPTPKKLNKIRGSGRLERCTP